MQISESGKSQIMELRCGLVKHCPIKFVITHSFRLTKLVRAAQIGASGARGAIRSHCKCGERPIMRPVQHAMRGGLRIRLATLPVVNLRKAEPSVTFHILEDMLSASMARTVNLWKESLEHDRYTVLRTACVRRRTRKSYRSVTRKRWKYNRSPRRTSASK